MWWIGSVLKYCKVPKYYDQDCRLTINSSNFLTSMKFDGTRYPVSIESLISLYEMKLWISFNLNYGFAYATMYSGRTDLYWPSWLRSLNLLLLLDCCRISSGSLGVSFLLLSEVEKHLFFFPLSLLFTFFMSLFTAATGGRAIARRGGRRTAFPTPFLFDFFFFRFYLLSL